MSSSYSIVFWLSLYLNILFKFTWNYIIYCFTTSLWVYIRLLKNKSYMYILYVHLICTSWYNEKTYWNSFCSPIYKYFFLNLRSICFTFEHDWLILIKQTKNRWKITFWFIFRITLIQVRESWLVITSFVIRFFCIYHQIILRVTHANHRSG